jgi:PPOX class probable F420-dependent enzyme
MSDRAIEFLERGNYMSLATRKKSGEFVATPVWFAPDGDSYYVFSAGDAGKVKRLRNFSESRIAPCTVTGKLTGGWIDTHAFVLESKEDQSTALRALHRKYRWQMAFTDVLSTLSGKKKKRAYIRVDLAD